MWFLGMLLRGEAIKLFHNIAVREESVSDVHLFLQKGEVKGHSVQGTKAAGSGKPMTKTSLYKVSFGHI